VLSQADNVWGVNVGKRKDKKSSDKVREDGLGDGRRGADINELHMALAADGSEQLLESLLGGLENLSVEDLAKYTESILESPEFLEFMQDPESLRSIVESSPYLSAMPEVQEALASESFSDPAKFRHMMSEGVSKLKDYAAELANELVALQSGENVELMADLLKSMQSQYSELAASISDEDLEDLRSKLADAPYMKELMASFGPEAYNEFADMVQDQKKFVNAARSFAFSPAAEDTDASRQA
jgi:hypothetical protein